MSGPGAATAFAEQVKEGIWNLVSNCLDVQRGESVLLLNECCHRFPI